MVLPLTNVFNCYSGSLRNPIAKIIVPIITHGTIIYSASEDAFKKGAIVFALSKVLCVMCSG